MTMGLFDRMFGRSAAQRGDAVYAAVVAKAREEHWYLAGGVADTIDGRFDMVAAVLSMVLLRLEAEPGNEELNAALAERFVDDMDGQLRQMGIGDIVVGKHIGRMMAMLGGRLGAYREGLAADDLTPGLRRNLYRDQSPDDTQVAYIDTALREFHARLLASDVAAFEGGQLP